MFTLLNKTLLSYFIRFFEINTSIDIIAYNVGLKCANLLVPYMPSCLIYLYKSHIAFMVEYMHIQLANMSNIYIHRDILRNSGQ